MDRIRDFMSMGEAAEDEEEDEPLLDFPPVHDSLSGNWSCLRDRNATSTATSWSWSNRIKGTVSFVKRPINWRNHFQCHKMVSHISYSKYK